MKRVIMLSIVLLMTSTALGDLAGYWSFDEGIGLTAADSSGNGKNGTLYAADSTNYPQWITGHNGSGSALQFNAGTTGSSNSNRVVVSLIGTEDLANLGEAFTIAMWVRRDNVTTSIDWPSLTYTDAYDLELASDPNANSSSVDSHDFFHNEIDADWMDLDLGVSTTEQKTLGTWYHLVISYDGNYLKKYINGVLIGGIAAPTTYSLTATSDLLIAARSDSIFFEGALDDVAIWADAYLAPVEVAKLAAGTVTPLTAQESAPQAALPESYFTLEDEIAWHGNEVDPSGYGWKMLWSVSFHWDVGFSAENTASAWWFDGTLIPGSRTTCSHMNKWDVINSTTFAHPDKNIDTYGITWIDPSWSGAEPNIGKIAAYITPGIAVCQHDWGYQRYDPEQYSWLDKDYFKTYARIASVNGAGAKMRVKSYSYINGDDPLDPNNLTYLGEVEWPLCGRDYEWQDFKHAFPKPTDGLSTTRVLVEVGLVSSNPDTVLYIDEFSPISDQSVTFYPGDIDGNSLEGDSLVYTKDLDMMTDQWLDTGETNEPRDGGMLINADFFADSAKLNIVDSVNDAPTGWTFTGSGTGEKGIYYVNRSGIDDVSVMNYTNYVLTPLGGSISAFIEDPNFVLEQTTENAVQGQTYYAMAYVMAQGWTAWKDFVTLTLEIDGVDVAAFARPMSRNRWRPIYGTYTAQATDAGKPITVKISYENTHTIDDPNLGTAFIGYVYLDDTMPQEWPEGRDNMLTNGSFEDLSLLKGGPLNAVYESIHDSDNWGAWFIDDVPAPPNWVFEVPTNFNEANEGGIWASGLYGSPLPTPGMNDVSIYASNDLILGQIIGALDNGTTYYLDMACGVNSGEYAESTVYWPTPSPVMHIELWRIPSDVSDGNTIHTGIETSAPGYVMIAEAYADATGNISGGTFPAAKWQLIGTEYTATSADTNVYVRVYGTGGAATMPEFAFSDVYLSTQKRLVPGGDITFDIDTAMEYDTLGPYTCYHGTVMGLETPVADIDGNCIVNFTDIAILALDWLKPSYNYITRPLE